jgi:dipeptidyl aminopeptidase/acylaminoacyl peptidase
MRLWPHVLPLPLLLLGCGSAPVENPTAPVVTQALPSPPASTAAQATTAPPPAPVTIDPDVPTGADAARDAELKKQAEGIVGVYTNTSPSLTPDGKKVVFLSDRDGLPQLYVGEVAKPDAPPLRLVTSAERIVGPALTPDGKSVIFRSDKGANERWSIFRVDLDGKNLVELTPGEELQRDWTSVPDKATPAVVVYSARAVSEAKSSLFVQEITPGKKPKRVYADPSIGGVTDVSRDGKWALWTRTVTISESTLSLVDLGTGTIKSLYPSAGKKVRIYDASFTADGKRAVLSTDDGGDRTILLSIDVQTGAETARHIEDRPPTAAISISSASKDGKSFVEGVFAGNHSELRVLDQKTLKPVRDIQVPLGAGGVGLFSEDGKRMAMTWGTADGPTDLYSVEVSTGKVTPLRKEARSGLASLPAQDVSIIDVSSFDGTKIPVNLYLPAALKKAPKPTPVMVIVHGGPAGASTVGWDPFRRFYAAQGYAIVEPNVRGSSGFGRTYEMADNGPKRPDGIKDVEMVARWAMTQPWADKDRMVIFGGSYGGYTVLMGVTRQTDIWRAGVNLFGISSWRTFMTSTSGLIHDLFLTEIGDPDKDGAFLDSISPLKDAAKIKAPLFVYAGANDIRVPKPESDQIVRSLRERRVPVEYMVATNEGHSVSHRENQVELLARSARFLEKALARR